MQLQISDHISQLLFDHECVVVPGFGAFLTRYYSAEVNPATHMLRPPGKRVYFNRSIKDNDGLLAKAVSLTEHISYELALARIEKEKSIWEDKLVSGQKLQLPGIGRLYIDEGSKTLQFSPSLENNYLPEAYGLAIFRSPAIQREAQIRKTIQKSIEKHIAAPVESSSRKSRRLPWAAVLGPLVFASILGASYYALQNEQLQDMASFNIFQNSRSISHEEAVTDAAPGITTPEEPAEARVETVEEKAAEVKKPVAETADASTVSKAGFHIVVGAFKEQDNAQQYIGQLKAQGFDAYSTGHRNGFTRVAVGNYSHRNEAMQAITRIRREVNSGAWIYAN